MRILTRFSLPIGVALSCAGSLAAAADSAIKVTPDWSQIVAVSKTNIAIQDCPEPPLYRGKPTHDKMYAALRGLNADYSRLQPWYPYPRLAVAELKPPQHGKTYWDFTILDPIVADFMQATAGHPVVFQPGTVPAWMTSSAPIKYPDNPDSIDWDYGRDGKFRESAVQQFADYQARLANWYIKGGFTDEAGVRHDSGHHYDFRYWEPLNEEDQRFSPEELTRLYDAAVASVRRIAPNMKFMGPTIADSATHPQYIAYFLNPAHHKAGIPIDMISYHFYTVPDSDETPAIMQYSMFRQAEKFLAAVGYIEAIRRELLPTAGTNVNELGSILPAPAAAQLIHPIPASYWNLSGAVWAYTYGNLAAKGIDIVTAAELIDYPGQFAGTTLTNWDNGEPNAHYWVVKLLHDSFPPGTKIVQQDKPDEFLKADPAIQLYAQGFITAKGEHRILLVNKRDHAIEVRIPGARGGDEQRVDQSTQGAPAAHKLSQDILQLPAMAVSVVTLAPSSPR